MILTKTDLEVALDRVMLRMTLRFGVMLAASLGALAALLRLARSRPIPIRKTLDSSCPRLSRASTS
jgi:hypothetical protein